MAMVLRFLILAPLLTASTAVQVSPVQKVIELLGECKAKVAKDLAAEAAVMEEYTTFCDDELKEKGYAIETAGREIHDLMATIEDSKATIAVKTDEIAEGGTLVAAKSTELAEAQAVRKGKNDEFVAAEKELVKSVDECSRAVVALEKGMALMQGGRKREAKQVLKAVKSAMSSVIAAIAIDTVSSRKLKSFIQQSTSDSDENDLSLHQPQAKQVAYESKSGGIVDTVRRCRQRQRPSFPTCVRRRWQILTSSRCSSRA